MSCGNPKSVVSLAVFVCTFMVCWWKNQVMFKLQTLFYLISGSELKYLL
jgi:hypothetical protein